MATHEVIEQCGNANFFDTDARTFMVCADRFDNGAVSYHACVVVPLGEQAATAALFPKSLRVRPNQLNRPVRPERKDEHGYTVRENVGYVELIVGFAATGVTGDKNEAGLKRYRSFVRHVERLGFRYVWLQQSHKQSLTESDFENTLEA